jgi:hypothetical protein
MFRRPAYCCCNQHAAGLRRPLFACVRTCHSVHTCARRVFAAPLFVFYYDRTVQSGESIIGLLAPTAEAYRVRAPRADNGNANC